MTREADIVANGNPSTSTPPLPADPGVPEKWRQEYAAFHHLLPTLLKSHAGQYVAIHEGRPVETGSDRLQVALRAYQRFGYIPIYVGRVSVEPPPIERIASPREVRP